VVFGALHNDNGIVHHDADRENEGKEGDHIHRKAQRRHGNEGPDNGHRHGAGRHKNGPEILQEDHDHQQHEDAGFKEGLVDLVDGSPGELGRVKRDGILDALRKPLAELLHEGFYLIGDIEGVGAGKLEDADASRRMAILLAELTVGLSAQLNPRDIPDADDAPAQARVDFDNDVLELLDILQPAQDIDGVLEVLGIGSRWHADLARRNLIVLLGDGLHHIGRGEAVSLQGLRIEPHPHAVLAHPEDIDISNPWQA